MSKMYVNTIKKDAVIQVPVTTDEISQFHTILLKHLDNQVKLDDKSWQIIEEFCSKIDCYAAQQNQTESKELEL